MGALIGRNFTMKLGSCSPRWGASQSEAKARSLSIAQQQMVEIARAFSINARILIMDEPTSSLTLNEVADLFRLVRRLREMAQQLFSSRTAWKNYSSWPIG